MWITEERAELRERKKWAVYTVSVRIVMTGELGEVESTLDSSQSRVILCVQLAARGHMVDYFAWKLGVLLCLVMVGQGMSSVPSSTEN